MDEVAAEKLFRHKVLALSRRRGLLSQERIDLLDSWRRSGFSVHNRVFVHPRDGREFEALVRYMMRPPVSLSRLLSTPGSHEVVYLPKAGHDEPQPTEAATPAEPSSPGKAPEEPAIPDGPYRAALRRRWAEARQDPSPASALAAASGHPRLTLHS